MSKSRRYAAVLSRLDKQTYFSSQPSSSAFSGYVPKCKENVSMQCTNTAVTTSSSSSSAEQRKTKVSFCLQASHDSAPREHGTNALSSKCVVTVSSSGAASVTSVAATCSKTVTSTTASLQPLTAVSTSELPVPIVTVAQLQDDSSDISLLCAELFVDNNASFCDQLLESCRLPCEQLDPSNVMLSDSSCNLKQDIPEPITDLAFDDFVEFDELFSCN